jgi:hypothetical protein
MVSKFGIPFAIKLTCQECQGLLRPRACGIARPVAKNAVNTDPGIEADARQRPSKVKLDTPMDRTFTF